VDGYVLSDTVWMGECCVGAADKFLELHMALRQNVTSFKRSDITTYICGQRVEVPCIISVYWSCRTPSSHQQQFEHLNSKES